MAKYAYHRTDANAQAIIDGLRAVGCSVELIGRPVDALLGFRGKTYAVEIKTRLGRLRPSQEAFFERWQGQADVVRTLDEALQVIGAVK